MHTDTAPQDPAGLQEQYAAITARFEELVQQGLIAVAIAIVVGFALMAYSSYQRTASRTR